MKGIEVFRKLKEMGKGFYTVADLEKITGLKKNSLYVSLKRWVEMGLLERVAQGIYVPAGERVEMEKIAMELYPPCYVSFESALFKYGVLNQMPFTLTLATTRKTRRLRIYGREVEFRKLKEDLFFGFEEIKGVYYALPEKAFLDLIYFYIMGKVFCDFDEMDLRKLNREKMLSFATSFPQRVREFVKNELPYSG